MFYYYFYSLFLRNSGDSSRMFGAICLYQNVSLFGITAKLPLKISRWSEFATMFLLSTNLQSMLCVSTNPLLFIE